MFRNTRHLTKPTKLVKCVFLLGYYRRFLAYSFMYIFKLNIRKTEFLMVSKILEIPNAENAVDITCQILFKLTFATFCIKFT